MKKTKERWIQWLVFIIYLFLFGLLIYKFSYQHIDSDSSSELILGKLLAKEGTLLSKNWFYSTELRVFNTNIVYFLVSLLVEDFLWIRTISNVILVAILFLSGYYCLKSYDKILYPFWASFLFILPFSHLYNGFVISGMYYVPHIAILLFTLGTVPYIENRKKGYKAIFILTSIISLLAGMGGLRQLLILYIPLAATHILLFIIEKTEEQKKLIPISVTYLIFSVIGYGINSAVLTKIYHFVNYNFMQTKEFQVEGIERMINGYIQNFGYYVYENIFSLKGLVGLCSIPLCLLFLYCIVIGVRNQKEKELHYKNTLIYLILTIVIFTGLYSMTTMEYNPRYLTPTITVFFIMILLFVTYETIPISYKKAIIGFLCIYVSLSSYLVVKDFITKDQLESKREVAEYIVKENITKGYATFWNGNVMTELTNGVIDMYVLHGGTTLDDFDTLSSCEWLLSADIINSVSDDDVCYIVSREEYKNSTSKRKRQFRPYRVFENNDYLVFRFSNDREFKKVIEKKTY